MLQQYGITVATAYTDASGRFTFPIVQGGSYTVHIELEGYEELDQRVDVDDNFGMFSTVTIALTRKAPVIRRGDAAIVDVTDFLERYPKKAVDAYKKGLDAESRDKTEQAIKNFEGAVTRAPDFFQAHEALGLAYEKAGKTDDAESEFLRAHYLNDSRAEPLNNLTSLYLKENRPDRAVSTGEQAVKLNARSAPAFFNLGVALYQTAMLDKAEAALNKALELAPKAAQIRLMLANVYLKLHKYDSLMDQLDHYLAENPKDGQRKQAEEMRQALLNAQAALQAQQP